MAEPSVNVIYYCLILRDVRFPTWKWHNCITNMVKLKLYFGTVFCLPRKYWIVQGRHMRIITVNRNCILNARASNGVGSCHHSGWDLCAQREWIEFVATSYQRMEFVATSIKWIFLPAWRKLIKLDSQKDLSNDSLL